MSSQKRKFKCGCCGNDLPKDNYSRTQFKKKSKRKCNKCIENVIITNDKISPENKVMNEPKYTNIIDEPEPNETKTVWITAPAGKTKPFKHVYQMGEQFGEQVGYCGLNAKMYKCKRKKDRKIFVVKCVPKDNLKHISVPKMIRQRRITQINSKIDVMRRLKHKYIIDMEECYEDRHTLYIVMEHCKGGDLFHRIRNRKRFKESDASRILKMILEAIVYLHENHRVVHCDIKPESILFADETENSIIKLFNFGESNVLPRLRSLRALVGSPYYTAPEILAGDYCHSCDLWSVGVVMFVMLFGYPPFYVHKNQFRGANEAMAIYRLIRRGFTPKTKRGYGPWFPKKIPVTPEAKDLMARLIERDTSKRLTAKEALQHPWIMNCGKRSQEIETENKSLAEILIFGYCKLYIPLELETITIIINFYNSKEIVITKYLVSQFVNFAAGNPFKHVITLLVGDKFKNLRAHEFENMKQLFSQLDINGNGILNENEFIIGMLNDLKSKNIKLKETFQELDFTKTGQIEFDDFLKVAIYDFVIASDQRLYELFRNLDDEDGKIKTSKLKEKIQHLDMYNNANDLLKIIDDVDLDSDGNIDYEEFLRALHPDFGNETAKWFWDAQADFDESKENK